MVPCWASEKLLRLRPREDASETSSSDDDESIAVATDLFRFFLEDLLLDLRGEDLREGGGLLAAFSGDLRDVAFAFFPFPPLPLGGRGVIRHGAACGEP